MKRLTILFALVVAALSNVIAQAPDGTGTTANYSAIEKKIQKSDQTIQDPKKGSDPKVYVERAKAFQEAAEANTSMLRNGMPVTELKLYLKEPKEVKQVEKDGAVLEQYVYDRININIEGGTVKSWEETKAIHPDPLKEALSSYNKAIELDKDGKSKKKISDGLKELKGIYEKVALNEYNLKNFEKSFNAFRSMVEIGENPLVNTADTLIVYYTGVTANEAGKPAEALKYFKKAMDMKYNNPSIYLDLSKAYAATGDSAQSLTALQNGFNKYPDNVSIIVELINYYLTKGQSKEALEYIAKAKATDPSNKSFYFAEGTLYDKMGNAEESIKAYNKAIEIDPKYYDAYYNAAVVYYNSAVRLLDEASQETNDQKYEQKKALAEEEFKKAIPFMEEASKINPNELSPLETLKSLYYRLKMNDKLEAVTAKIKALKGE
jgi:tetratricopeptide (TPR) repeat protein